MILGPYRDTPTLEQKLKIADAEIAALNNRIKVLEQQLAFRDQQLSAERAAKRQAEILRDDVLRRTREAAQPTLAVTLPTATLTSTGAFSTTIRVPDYREWSTSLFGGPIPRTPPPAITRPTAPAQSPDGFGELERRTQAVRDARAEAYKPAPREKTRFDFLEVD